MAVDFKQIPENIRDRIFGNDFADREAEAFDGLSDDERHAVQAAIMGAYTHEFSVSEFPKKIQEAVPGDKGRDLAKHLLGWNLMKIQEWFPESVRDTLISLGGDPNDYRPKLSLEHAIDQALEDVNVELIPPRTRETVLGKMGEYLNGEVDQASLLESMLKSPKIGGWGWDPGIATPVIERLALTRADAEKSGALFVPKGQMPEPPVIPAQDETDPLEALFADLGSEPVEATVAVSEGSAVADPFELLLADAPMPVILSVAKDLTKWDSSAAPQNDRTFDGPSGSDPFMELLASLQFEAPTTTVAVVDKPDFPHREAAHGAPAKDAFEKALHSSDILLEHELREINERRDELLRDVPESAIVVSATLEGLLDRILVDAQFKTDDQHLMKRVRSILGSRLRDIRGGEETARLLTRIADGKPELAREKVEELAKLTEQAFLEFQRKVIERSMQRERARRVRVREETLEKKREEIQGVEKELNDRYKKLTGSDVTIKLPMPTDAVISSKARDQGNRDFSAAPRNDKTPKREVKVSLSSNSVMPETAPKAKMNDVKYQRQLANPIDEMRTMRLSDFRMLSKDPQAAAKKVGNKIELLGGESYEKKVKGIAAWRESPIMKMYLDATKSALDESIPLATVLTMKKKTTPEMLTIEECHAIRELNATLRY